MTNYEIRTERLLIGATIVGRLISATMISFENFRLRLINNTKPIEKY